MSDIRTSRRFPVQLPLKVLGNQTTPTGETSNISAAGVYLLVNGVMEVDSAIEFEITIPGETIGAKTDVRLHCQGRVVRRDIDKESGRTGVACVIDGYELLRDAEVGGE